MVTFLNRESFSQMVTDSWTWLIDLMLKVSMLKDECKFGVVSKGEAWLLFGQSLVSGYFVKTGKWKEAVSRLMRQ